MKQAFLQALRSNDRLGIIARACLFRVQVVVAYGECPGEPLLQFAEQRGHRSLLRFGARVLWLSACVEPSLVAYPDRVGVVSPAVRPRFFYGAALVGLAVARYVIVITYVAEVPVRYVVSAAFFEAQALALGRGRAVDDYKSYCSHDTWKVKSEK